MPRQQRNPFADNNLHYNPDEIKYQYQADHARVMIDREAEERRLRQDEMLRRFNGLAVDKAAIMLAEKYEEHIPPHFAYFMIGNVHNLPKERRQFRSIIKSNLARYGHNALLGCPINFGQCLRCLTNTRLYLTEFVFEQKPVKIEPRPVTLLPERLPRGHWLLAHVHHGFPDMGWYGLCNKCATLKCPLCTANYSILEYKEVGLLAHEACGSCESLAIGRITPMPVVRGSLKDLALRLKRGGVL